MRNISDRFYPVISTRPNRGAVTATYTSPKGIFHKNGLFYIDGTNAYYKGTQRFTVSNGDKIIVGMGAYICVFPDGKVFNTAKGTVESMTASYTQSGSIKFEPLSDKSVFTKITATGIHNSFSKNDNVTIAGCTNASYNATKIITDIGTNYIVVTGALDAAFTQASGLTFKREIPSMDFVCERDNRLWGCSSANHEVYCCKIGDPKNWYSYETGADMSWASTVGSDGDFTACTKFSTYMMFFKESVVHILRGDKPANFSLSEKQFPGVRTDCSKSIQIINDTLYYVSRNGVYSYDGAVPQKISDNITGEISNAVGGQYDGKYYLSCLLDGNRRLIVYDPKTRAWDFEDEEVFKFTSFSDGMLYYVDGGNNLTTIDGNRTETIEWFLETGDIREGDLDEKYVSKFKYNLWLTKGSEVTILMKFDDEPSWKKKGHVYSTKEKTYVIPVMPRRCGKYRIRLEGRGQFKLLAMSREVEKGSDVNGNIQRINRR